MIETENSDDSTLGTSMKTSPRGIEFIKSKEGFSATPYRDSAGLLTIGFGHLIRHGECFGAISSVEATALFEKDLQPAEECIKKHVTVPITQNQFDALVSFIYNLGCGNFAGSTLLKKLNAGLIAEAAREFLRWDRAAGKEIPGLLVRRGQEMSLFLEV